MDVEEIDLLSPKVLADPYPVYRELRENHPVFWDDRLKAWVVSRYQDVHAALLDSARFASDGRVEKQISRRVPAEFQPVVAPLVRLASQWVAMVDPPDHTRLRQLLNKAFTPRIVAGLEPYVTAIVKETLGRGLAEGRMDVMADFAYPLPAYVMADLFGFPRQDAELLKRWWDSLKIFFGGGPDLAAAAGAALTGLEEMTAYFTAAAAEKRARPGDDFISVLVYGDNGAFLNDEELTANLIFVLGASYSTTMDMIGNGTLALLRHRDQWDLLTAQPELAAPAVDEILRYDGPVQVTQRITRTEVELHGQTIAEDELVFLVRGAAHRDPDQFQDPDRLQIARGAQLAHVAFGAGAHYCIGAALGRMVGKVAFGELAANYPTLRLDPDAEPRWRADALQFRGLATLPVISTPARS